MNDLRRHKNSSPFIRDFLDFITHRMFIVEDASLARASGAEVADHLNHLTKKCFDSDAYCLPSPAASSTWDIESLDSINSSLTALSSSTPDDFDLDFTATTEEVGAPAAWHFSSLDDVGALAQWNTAPIGQSATSTYASQNCADILGNWNYTAPVAWDYSNNPSPTGSGINRKRKLDVEEDLDRRVSPKTSTTGAGSLSPETKSSSSATVESPVVEAGGKEAEKRFACPYYKNNPAKFRQKRTCCGPGWPTVHRVK